MSVRTVRDWRSRGDAHDCPHTREDLIASLSEVQEVIVVALRRTLGLSLDDLLAVTCGPLHPELNRSALDRGCVAMISPGWPISRLSIRAWNFWILKRNRQAL